MNTYIVTEKDNINSYRKGHRLKAKSLTSAKRAARRRQMFFRTVMVLSTPDGLDICYAKHGEPWSYFLSWEGAA